MAFGELAFQRGGTKMCAFPWLTTVSHSDVEAWEDYGRRDYKGGDHSGSSSRESVIPNGVSKEDRMERAQSIWDIEVCILKVEEALEHC